MWLVDVNKLGINPTKFEMKKNINNEIKKLEEPSFWDFSAIENWLDSPNLNLFRTIFVRFGKFQKE